MNDKYPTDIIVVMLADLIADKMNDKVVMPEIGLTQGELKKASRNDIIQKYLNEVR